MNLLDNELVQKYFGPMHDGCPPHCRFDHTGMTAFRILDAMGQFIQTGDRYLAIIWDSSVEERISVDPWFRDFHPGFLRLPDEFQKKECDCLCHKGQYCRECKNTFPKPTPSPEKCECGDLCGVDKVLQGAVPDAVADKIQKVIFDFALKEMSKEGKVQSLRDLVALVRAEKK